MKLFKKLVMVVIGIPSFRNVNHIRNGKSLFYEQKLDIL